jgi:uroporphyrinogen III methyltransferase/synthase
VPGISSVIAGPNYAGIPLTHREHTAMVTVFTGHEDPTKPESTLDYKRIAELPGTKVIVMGTERIKHIADSLIAHGMAADTPVGMIRWGTTGRQQSVEGTLSTIAYIAEKAKLAAPTVTVIGDVVKLRAKLNWFEHRPLFGQRVVVTRTREQASQLSRQLLELGAEVLEIPTIKIVPPDNKQDLMDALLGLGEYDWIVFTSPNGVDAFFNYFFKAFEDLRDIGGLRIAAVGSVTAQKLRDLHLKVDLMPDEYVAKKIVSAFKAYESIENLRILLVRAQVANSELPKGLEEAGAIVDDIAIYKTVPETEDRNGAAARFAEAGADWITFTSSSTVQNFHARFNLPQLVKQHPHLKLASIGPETSRALAELGLKPTVQAREHTIDGLVHALQKHR